MKFLARIPTWVYVTVAAIVLLLEIPRRLIFGNGCFFLALTDIPCPTCGMTRAVLMLLTFNIREAFILNPALPTVPIAAIFCALAFADKKRARLWLILLISDVAALFTVWVIRLLTGAI